MDPLRDNLYFMFPVVSCLTSEDMSTRVTSLMDIANRTEPLKEDPGPIVTADICTCPKYRIISIAFDSTLKNTPAKVN